MDRVNSTNPENLGQTQAMAKTAENYRRICLSCTESMSVAGGVTRFQGPAGAAQDALIYHLASALALSKTLSQDTTEVLERELKGNV